MGNLTVQAAESLLSANPAAYATREALLGLLKQLDVHAEGAVTVLNLVNRTLRKNAVSGVFMEWLYANCHSFQPTFFLEAKMAFVNERITGDDRKRYNIPEIELRIVVSQQHVSAKQSFPVAEQQNRRKAA